MCLVICIGVSPFKIGRAENDYEQIESGEVYKIYSESGDLLAERQSVFVGDSLLTKEFVKYKIVQVDEENNIAFAEFEERLRKPEVSVNYEPTKISQTDPTLCLYMTHNDESYITGDGVDSVYGAGGIHDIANLLKDSFEKLGVRTYIDETLHIPHDSYAYSRSKKTAQKMLDEFSPDAIFDIHRDGASRSTYVKKINGVDRCKVRIVVGKASANYEIAEQFALYLLSVASEVCDWLFLDIYYASGHYNQGLYNKSLLFEMGSHLVEKSLVEKTVPELANVVKTALFYTTVDKESGDLTINGDADNNLPTLNDSQVGNSTENKVEDNKLNNSANESVVGTNNPTINEILDEMVEKPASKTAPTITYFVVVVFGAGVIAGVVLGLMKKKPKKRKGKK